MSNHQQQRTPPARAERVSTFIQVCQLLGLGVATAIYSWTNVLKLAGEHGQQGWRGWVVTACVETLALGAGLEVRRRLRLGQLGSALVVPVALMAASGALQLAAQVQEAEHTFWGVLFAALPAATFLVLAKLFISRSNTPAGPLALALARAGEAEQQAHEATELARAAQDQLAQARAEAMEAYDTAAQATADAAAAQVAQVQACEQAEALARQLQDQLPHAQALRRERAGTTTDDDRREVIRAELRKNIGAGKNPIKAAIIAAGHSPGGTERLQELINEVRAQLTQRQVVPLHAAEA